MDDRDDGLDVVSQGWIDRRRVEAMMMAVRGRNEGDEVIESCVTQNRGGIGVETMRNEIVRTLALSITSCID